MLLIIPLAPVSLLTMQEQYNALQTQHRGLCHSMQRRRWLDRRLQKHFHHSKAHAVGQASAIQQQHERFRCVVRQRRAALLMECLSFAFYVAKQQDAARARIMYGTAVSDDNGEWEALERVANPEGVADPVPEEKEAVQVAHSELVLPPGVSTVPRHFLPVDVQREANKTQDETLQ